MGLRNLLKVRYGAHVPLMAGPTIFSDTVENSPVGASLAFENPPTCIRKDTTDFLLSLPGRCVESLCKVKFFLFDGLGAWT